MAYSAESVKHWQYGSQLTFHSDADFSTLHPALLKLCRNVSKSVETDIGQQHSYELISLQVDYDQLTSKYPIGRFSIQRRDNTPFSQNKYFSDAPLQTEQHIQILEQFEAELLNQTPPATD